jgi:hypothetical protein
MNAACHSFPSSALSILNFNTRRMWGVNFTTLSGYLQRQSLLTHGMRDLFGPITSLDASEKTTYLLPLPGFKPRFFDRAARSLVAIPAELPWIYLTFCPAHYILYGTKGWNYLLRIVLLWCWLMMYSFSIHQRNIFSVIKNSAVI